MYRHGEGQVYLELLYLHLVLLPVCSQLSVVMEKSVSLSLPGLASLTVLLVENALRGEVARSRGTALMFLQTTVVHIDLGSVRNPCNFIPVVSSL